MEPLRPQAIAAALLLTTFALAAPAATATPCSATLPPAVADLAANDPSVLPLSLSWDPAPAHCLTRITVERSIAGRPWTAIAALASDASAYTDPGLADCTAAEYRVVQSNRVGPGLGATVDGSRHHGVPAAPAGLTVTVAGIAPQPYGDTTVAWDADAGPCAATYEATRTARGASEPLHDWDGDRRLVDIMPGCTDVTYAVRARNLAGPSAWAEATVRADNKLPSAVPGVRAEGTASVSATFHWGDPVADCGHDGFVLRFHGLGYDSERSLGPDARSFTVSGLAPCQELRVDVLAATAFGAAGPSMRYLQQPYGVPCPLGANLAPATLLA